MRGGSQEQRSGAWWGVPHARWAAWLHASLLPSLVQCQPCPLNMAWLPQATSHPHTPCSGKGLQAFGQHLAPINGAGAGAGPRGCRPARPVWAGEELAPFSRETSPGSLSAGLGVRERPRVPGEHTPAHILMSSV